MAAPTGRAGYVKDSAFVKTSADRPLPPKLWAGLLMA